MSTPSLLNIPYLYKAGTLYSQIPESGAGDFTVTRATTPTAGRSTRINKDGLIELVADNVPRLDYPLGGAVNGCPALLVEPAATNSIRNNSMVGAVAGSPGTAPTNWSISSAGLTQTIVGTGTENGVQFIDFRFNGTATGTLAVIEHDLSTQIVASDGQTWTYSTYAKLVSAPTSAGAYRINIREFTSVGGTVAEGTFNYTPTSSLARYSATRTLSGGPTVARVAGRLYFTLANGSPYDFTIRIGYPQMELGSVATSVIPTTTQAITRAAEVISRTSASALIGQTEGTIYAEVAYSSVAAVKTFIAINDGTTDNRIAIRLLTTTSISARIVVSGTSYDFSQSITAIPSSGTLKMALAYKANDYVLAFNGTTYASTTTRPVPATNAVTLGNNGFGSDFTNDRIRAAAIYPNRLTNAQLATLTAP